MPDRYWTLQLSLPCPLPEVTEWWEEVVRVMGDEHEGDDPVVSVIEHKDGHSRLTVHLADST
jgi:hypothetical protein